MREVLTYPIEATQVREELAFLVQYLVENGYDDCDVKFGWNWGAEDPAAPNWEYKPIRCRKLVSEVERAENAKWGELGYDDLYVRPKNAAVEFHFCNDTDIHMYFEESNAVVEAFYARWKERGFNPAEWIQAQSGPPTERVRFN